MDMKNVIISDELKDALIKGKAIVALESTIISHGMPYPENVKTACMVEEAVRSEGAIPATIAIINGEMKVGLSPQEIEYLGKVGREVHKVSRRDIPFVVSQKLDGATTVSATMILASLAGIKIFATGGIGGVHRGAEESFDISADLQELAKTNVAVVCAGIKSILDLGRTLEYLETQGVPVIGYKTNVLPAFYTRESDFEVDFKIDQPSEIAAFIKCKWEMGLAGGVVIANPIPEKYSYDKLLIDEAINTALKEAKLLDIKGKEITPFLLSYISNITKGKSLEVNIQLILSNARLASKIAQGII